MERYKVVKQLGDGTYGSVHKAVNRATGEIVAIKKMKKKFYSWDECMQLREVKSLRKLNHENIVRMKEVIRENDELFFVFEFMDQNLFELGRSRGRPFDEDSARRIMSQILSGLAFMHKHGFFHRDMKPENMLCRGGTVKLADFGLAREIRSRPPYTEYVSTRWYRAPEILLRSPAYNSPIDMFAAGCIMAELLTGQPLFPGASETDQVNKVFEVLGTPSETRWPQGRSLLARLGMRLAPRGAQSLRSVLGSGISDNALELIADLIALDPSHRPTAAAALRYPWFQQTVTVGRALGLPGVDDPVAMHGPTGHVVGESTSSTPAGKHMMGSNSKAAQLRAAAREEERLHYDVDDMERLSPSERQGMGSPGRLGLRKHSGLAMPIPSSTAPRASPTEDQLSRHNPKKHKSGARLAPMAPTSSASFQPNGRPTSRGNQLDDLDALLDLLGSETVGSPKDSPPKSSTDQAPILVRKPSRKTPDGSKGLRRGGSRIPALPGGSRPSPKDSGGGGDPLDDLLRHSSRDDNSSTDPLLRRSPKRSSPESRRHGGGGGLDVDPLLTRKSSKMKSPGGGSTFLGSSDPLLARKQSKRSSGVPSQGFDIDDDPLLSRKHSRRSNNSSNHDGDPLLRRRSGDSFRRSRHDQSPSESPSSQQPSFDLRVQGHGGGLLGRAMPLGTENSFGGGAGGILGGGGPLGGGGGMGDDPLLQGIGRQSKRRSHHKHQRHANNNLGSDPLLSGPLGSPTSSKTRSHLGPLGNRGGGPTPIAPAGDNLLGPLRRGPPRHGRRAAIPLDF